MVPSCNKRTLKLSRSPALAIFAIQFQAFVMDAAPPRQKVTSASLIHNRDIGASIAFFQFHLRFRSARIRLKVRRQAATGLTCSIAGRWLTDLEVWRARAADLVIDPPY